LTVLGEQVVFEGKKEDDEEEEVLGLASLEDFSSIDHVC
jgi:hypothetical protein